MNLKVITKKASDIANMLALYVASSLTLIMFVITVYGAFMRYLLGRPRPWPMPVARILMIWVSILGITVALKKNEHVAVESLRERLPFKYRKYFYIFIYLLIGFVGLIFAWYGWEVFLTQDQTYMITASIRIPYKYSMIAIPISGVITIIHSIYFLSNLQEGFIIKQETTLDTEIKGDIKEG